MTETFSDFLKKKAYLCKCTCPEYHKEDCKFLLAIKRNDPTFIPWAKKHGVKYK